MEREPIKLDLEKSDRPEHNFDNGVVQILVRIDEILKKQPHAVVAFSGSGNHVGKTYLAKTLINALHQKGIYCRSFHGIENVRVEKNQDHMVIILDQMEWQSHELSSHNQIKNNHSAKIAESFEGSGYDVKGIDLWVGIYRPDKPFTSSPDSSEQLAPVADIIIRNGKATDAYKLK
jgi:hypothetical protein